MKPYLPKFVVGVALAAMAVPASRALEMAIQNTQELSFGSFVAGVGGSVTVAPSGARSASGGVLLVPSSAGAAALPASSHTASMKATQCCSGEDGRIAPPGVDAA